MSSPQKQTKKTKSRAAPKPPVVLKKPVKRAAPAHTPAAYQLIEQNQTQHQNTPHRHYQPDMTDRKSTVVLLAQIVVLTILLISIVAAVIRYVYLNDPARASRAKNEMTLRTKTSECGHEPHLIVVHTDVYGQDHAKFYTPNTEAYRTLAVAPDTDPLESKRLVCTLEEAVATKGKANYTSADESDVAKAYVKMLTDQGFDFLVPHKLPDNYQVRARAIGANFYQTSYGTSDDLSIDGITVHCQLDSEKTAADSITQYRTDSYVLATNANVTVYGKALLTFDQRYTTEAKYAQVGAMWCSFLSHGERLLGDTVALDALLSLSPENKDLAAHATPASN